MLSLVSLAHKVSRADASHSELQTRVPGTKRHLSSRTVWGSATHDTAIQDGGRRPCAEMLRSGAREHARAHPARTLPPPPLIERHKAAPPTVPRGERRNSRERARTSPFFDQRLKLSFAYEPNLVSFYWYERHRAEGPFLGTDSGRSVTQAHWESRFYAWVNKRLTVWHLTEPGEESRRLE